MPKIVTNDINFGYVDFINSLSNSFLPKTRNEIAKSIFNKIKQFVELFFIPIFILLLILYGLLLIIFLRVYLLFVNKQEFSELSKNAIRCISEFISQYPMHLYPVVAKSFELAFARDNVDKILNKVKGRIVEFAIGDGTLSGRIFNKQNRVTGFDINPFSLVHTKNYQHVSKRIVADCLNPPIGNKGASFIVAINLIHHVTNKERVLLNWVKIAPYALFNENTNYWASAWYKPFILELFGLNDTARNAAQYIEERGLQALWTKEQLQSVVKKYYDIIEEKSFFNKKVFFLSSICSALLFCYGPPTPKLQKRVMNGLLRPIIRAITYHMAKALIEYDAILPRNKDSFIFWSVTSKLIDKDSSSSQVSLVCPDCRERLQDNICNICKRTFEEKDGMFFLLPKDLLEEISYSSSNANVLDKEHL